MLSIRTYSMLRKGKELLRLDTVRYHGILSRLMFISTVIVLYLYNFALYNFIYYVSFLPATVAAN